MTLSYRPEGAGWLVDLELPLDLGDANETEPRYGVSTKEHTPN